MEQEGPALALCGRPGLGSLGMRQVGLSLSQARGQCLRNLGLRETSRGEGAGGLEKSEGLRLQDASELKSCRGTPRVSLEPKRAETAEELARSCLSPWFLSSW